MKLSIAALVLGAGIDSAFSFSSLTYNNDYNNLPPPANSITNDPSAKFPPTATLTSTNDATSVNEPPPIPFSATKADPSNTDILNPLVRPIAFTKETNDEENGMPSTTNLQMSSVPPTSPRIAAEEDLSMPSTTPESKVSINPPPTPSTPNDNNKYNNKNNDDFIFVPTEGKDLKLGDDSTVTERMLKKVPSENQAGGAGGASTLEAFKRAEANWEKLKAFQPFEYDKKLLRWTQNGHGPPPQFVATDGAFGNPKCWAKLKDSIEKELDYDVVVCGGTLGIFFAMYLQLQGHDVAVLEAGKLRGREQEWNISLDELLELKDLGILTQDDIDAVISTEFPACRSGFKNKEVTPLTGGYFENGELGYECYTPDILNLGVAPALLLERVSQRFLAIGGVIKDQTRLSGVCVSELVGTALDLGEDEEPITARLVLDCMGNASPISAQQRYGKKPDGICTVVGSCAGGFDKETNLYGDLIYTNQPIVTRNEKGSNQVSIIWVDVVLMYFPITVFCIRLTNPSLHLKYFWEAFPVKIGRGNEPGTSDVKTTYSKCCCFFLFNPHVFIHLYVSFLKHHSYNFLRQCSLTWMRTRKGQAFLNCSKITGSSYRYINPQFKM
jgi:hypothetical protein